MRRRDLVGTLAGGAAVALVGARDGRPAQSRKPLLAFSCYGMKKIPVREAIGHIAKIGYKAVELTLMPGWDTEPKLLSNSHRFVSMLGLIAVTVTVAMLTSGDSWRAEVVPLLLFGMIVSLAYHQETAMLFSAAISTNSIFIGSPPSRFT